ncbi:hypothetical protein TV39_00875 [Arthrobacter sp. SPG23]|nr:hypothetical protein TV39_00875 [Arthrobacter sp. SPG23]
MPRNRSRKGRHRRCCRRRRHSWPSGWPSAASLRANNISANPDYSVAAHFQRYFGVAGARQLFALAANGETLE